MTRLPGLMFVVDSKKERIAVDEANKLGIPVIAIVDTNADPDLITVPIAGNDDAIRSVELITRAIADAVLYEGYVLWPYRRSALKNTRRWTFGGVFPAAHAERHPDDRSRLRAECLLEGAPAREVDVRVRFLHVVRRQVFEAGKPVAAICHAPWVLIEAGVVKGRRMTSWPSLQTDLRNAGANWVDEEVVVDGNLTTSRNPDDLDAFTAAIVEQFARGDEDRVDEQADA